MHSQLRVKEETIDQIRQSLDIVEVVMDYVQLKKQGRNYFACCPFHSEQTPSFSVSPDKQIFHCFGCGMGGNVFTFIMEIEGMSFIETVQFLAEKANIDLGETVSNQVGQTKRDKNDRESLYFAFDLISQFYHYLIKNEKFGNLGLTYLLNRGFTKEIIQKFNIGYAVDSWDTLTHFLQRRKIDLALMEKVGILSKRQFDHKYFDRFRNRIMFPIANHRGKVVSFAGRVLTDEKPKYINTPESEIFHKGNLLFGFHLARQEIKRTNQVILFEGYLDVIKAHQCGVTNCVASMGTSLTETQASLLTRHAETIIICYDSDDAGIEASFRAAAILGKEQHIIKIAKVPNGLDPDDYMTKFGGEKFSSDVIGASQTVMSFKMNYFRRGRDLNDEGDRMRYVEEVIKEIATLTKAVERDHYLRMLSDEFSISLDALKHQQYQIYRQRQKKNQTQNQNHPKRPPVIFNKLTTLYPAHEMAERRLLAHMMRNDEISEKVQEVIGGSFHVPLHQAIAAHLYAYYLGGNPPDVGAFIQYLKDTELQQKASDIAMMDVNEEVSDLEIDDYMNQIQKYNKITEVERLEAERKKAEQNNDFEGATNLLAEMITIKNQLNRR